jgi:hypothetical protein
MHKQQHRQQFGVAGLENTLAGLITIITLVMAVFNNINVARLEL